MKNYILFLCLFLFSVYVNAQDYTWELKQSGTSLGDPTAYRFNKPDIVFYGSVDRIYASYNRGESFSQIGTPITGSTRIKNIILSEKDSSTMLVALEKSPSDQIVKTTNYGQTWSVSLDNASFSYFGIPMTPDPSHPDTIYTMTGNSFLRSTDFGGNWTTMSNVTSFSVPCDIEVFPDSSNVILVGDNGTGIFRSRDYGATWTQVFATSGEIPTIAIDKVNNSNALATRWGGGGGFLKSTNYGLTWTPITFFNGLNMWGVDYNPFNSKMYITGQYSGGRIYLTYDDASTWITTNISGSNYSVVIVDSATIYAAQSNGFYKLRLPAVPVEMTSFSHSVNGNSVKLMWSTASEINNSGFEIQISLDNSEFSGIGFVSGNGTTTEKNNYSFEYSLPGTGNYSFRLKQIDFNGNYEYSETIEIRFALPVAFSLGQNYPNPFNPATRISFTLPESGYFTISLYSVTGEKITVLSSGFFEMGHHFVMFNAGSLPSGIYLYKAEFTGTQGVKYSEVKKLTLSK